jgi:hypothetical protein
LAAGDDASGLHFFAQHARREAMLVVVEQRLGSGGVADTQGFVHLAEELRFFF